MKKTTYKLSGIDCASCALKIEESLNKTDGIYESNLNFLLMKLMVSYEETMINEEEIELLIHKSLSGVRIVSKNNQLFTDTYEEPGIFKRIIFKPRSKR